MKIVFFNASGEEIGSVDRIRKARWSQQGASDEKQMDTFKKAHPEVVRAEIGSLKFTFDADGKAIAENA